jgi:hypothetical protein
VRTYVENYTLAKSRENRPPRATSRRVGVVTAPVRFLWPADRNTAAVVEEGLPGMKD